MPSALWIVLGLVALFAVSAMAKTVTPNPDGSVNPSPSGSISISILALAIARAEGYYASGSKAQRFNNPGNIFSNGGQTYNTYDSPEEGFAALENTLRGYYAGSWIAARVTTWRDVAWMYVNGTAPGAAVSRPGSGDDPDRWLSIVQADLFDRTGIMIEPLAEFRNYVTL